MSCPFLSFAQEVGGRVVDAAKNPVANAQVVVSRHDSIIDSDYTDAKGQFELNYGQLRDFDIRAYFLGYRTEKQTVVNASGKVKIQDIVLTEDTLSLEGVTVTAKATVNQGDRILLYPNPRDVKTSQNALDLFQKSNLPGLSVNAVSQTLAINGRTDIRFRINGINASQEEIAALDPGRIARIEYERLPASIRDVESAGVINVVLNRATGTSLSTAATGAVSTGFLNGNLNLTSGFTNSYFTLNYGVNWRDYDEWTSEESEMFLHPERPASFLKKTKPSPFGYLQQNVNLGYTYIKNKNTFNARFLNSIYSSHEDYDTDIDDVGEGQFFNRNIHSKTKLYIPAVDLYYIRNIDEGRKLEMNLTGSFSTSDHERNTLDRAAGFTRDSVASDIDGNSKSIAYEVLYSHSGPKVNYHVGLKSSYTALHNESKVDFSQDDIKRLDIYPYASVGGDFRFLTFNLGTGLKVLHNKSGDLSKTYYSNMSNLSVNARFKQWNLRYALRYLPNYPQLSSMTDILQQQDPYLYITGNPRLKTSQLLSNNLDATYEHKYFTTMLSLYSSHEYDPIRELLSYREGKYISRVENIEKAVNYGAYFYVYVPSILNMFKIRFDAGVNYYQTTFSGSRKSELTNFYYSAYLEFYKDNFSLFAGWRKPSKTLMGEFITQGENNSYITASYRIKNVLLGVSLYYPFSSGAESSVVRESETYRNSRTVTIKDNAYMVVLGLVYNINWGKSLFGVSKNLNNLDFSSPIRY